jgi:hypothetical protein
MADPLTLAALGSVAIAEGIKFLYGQVGELLKRRREVKERAEVVTDELAAAPPVARMEIEVPPSMGGKRFQVDANLRVVDDNADRMARLRGELANYADETLEVDTGNEALLRTVAELRVLVEEAISTHLTFAGEGGGRPATGSPLAVGRVRVSHFKGGAATGLRADEFTEGGATGEVDVDVAEHGSTLTGAQFGRIGAASPRREPPS